VFWCAREYKKIRKDEKLITKAQDWIILTFPFDENIHDALQQQHHASRSIGLGWSIPDSMVDEPYFYLILWSEKEIESFNQLPALKNGNWILSGWKGGILKLSEIQSFNTVDGQREMVKMFFSSGIKMLRDFYEKNCIGQRGGNQ
jgi:hypothetical protein